MGMWAAVFFLAVLCGCTALAAEPMNPTLLKYSQEQADDVSVVEHHGANIIGGFVRLQSLRSIGRSLHHDDGAVATYMHVIYAFNSIL